MQSKWHSFIEATLNTLSGFVLSMLMWPLFVTPLFGIQISHTDNFLITLGFTVISVVRSYAWRRIFNKRRDNYVG